MAASASTTLDMSQTPQITAEINMSHCQRIKITSIFTHRGLTNITTTQRPYYFYNCRPFLIPPSRNLSRPSRGHPKAAPKKTDSGESGGEREGEGGEVKNFNYSPFADGDTAQHTHLVSLSLSDRRCGHLAPSLPDSSL